MKKYYIFVFQFVLVQCIVPSLIVKKLDRTVIARKRQDTMDMCRIFTEDNEKMHKKYKPPIINSYRPEEKFKVDASMDGPAKFVKYNSKVNRRFKRDATIRYEVNPALNADDKKRIENIVDKLYDDMQDKEERVTYRKNEKMTTISINAKMNETQQSRRFNFAPANLTGPVANHYDKSTVHPDDTTFESKARWKHGIVPYFIDSNTYDTHLTEAIMKAFDYFEKATCIRLQKLREKPTDLKSLKEVTWLYISNPTGIRQCVHSNEKRIVNGVQMTVFGYDCMSFGDIVHEVMHILGYSHEHLRSDRDQYISILWDNIKPGYKKYFTLNEGTGYDLESLPYDYTSILHYPSKAFSRNGKTTILTEPGIKIGQREGLSEIDVEKVALIYSNECVSRNKEYLFQTCPSVVRSVIKPVDVTQGQIEAYFENRLWPFGIITYKLKDNMEFSTEERENLNAVFRHIEKETCLQFRDIAAIDENDSVDTDEVSSLPDEDQKNTTMNDTKTPITTHRPEVNAPNADNNITETETVTNIEEHETQVPEEIENKEIIQPDEVENSVVSDISSEYNSDIENNIPEIILTKPRANKNTESGNRKPIIIITSGKNNINNEIYKDDVKAQNNETKSNIDKYFIRKMSFNEKKALLKRAKAKLLKDKSKRVRRELNSQPRRHTESILTLKRSPAQNCVCPEPGRPTGNQVLEIGAGCFNSVNDLLHFFVHVLGLDHQHNMHDRDNYLHILWDNLSPDVRQDMEHKLPPEASVGFSYDYQSVMHYPWLQIKNGRTNIMYPVWNDGWSMGHWQGLSSTDVQKINLLYFKQCTERQKQERE